jgi:hypothetical protein
VDWIRFPHEVDAVLHRGEGAPVVRLRWMYTDQPFLPVGTQSAIMCRVWDADPHADLDVGQLSQNKDNYVQDARWIVTPNLDNTHQCHPEWFATGEPWPTSLPPTVYDEHGIPDCCEQIQPPPIPPVVPPVSPPYGPTCCDSVGALPGNTYHIVPGVVTHITHWWQFTLPAGYYRTNLYSSTFGWGAQGAAWMNIFTGPACDNAHTLLAQNAIGLRFQLATAATVCIQVSGTPGDVLAWYELLFYTDIPPLSE